MISPGQPLRPPLILKVRPGVRSTNQEHRDSHAKGAWDCSDRRETASHQLGVLLDNSTSPRPHTGHKVTPGLTEATVEARTKRNRKRESLSFGSALNHKQNLPLLAGNNQLSETKIRPIKEVQLLKPIYPIGALITPCKPLILKGQSRYRESLRVERMLGDTHASAQMDENGRLTN